MYHPNVWENGSICLDVIQDQKWSPAASMEARITNTILLLQEPNPDSPANGSAAQDWGRGKEVMRKAVKKYYKY